MRRTPMNRGTKGLTRRTPLTNRPSGAAVAFERPPAPPMDLERAAIALTRGQESMAAGPGEHRPVPDVSKPTPRPSNTGFPPVVRQTILDRDHMTCVRCGRDVTVTGYNLQHRDNRAMGGTRDASINWPSNGLTLCGSPLTGCHGWVEANPDLGERLGYAVQGWADPETVPFLHHRLGWMMLDRRGGAYPCPEPPNADARNAGRRKDRP